MSIAQVAIHAGVSTATVSRVLNNFPGVEAETARQVRASVEALHYIPPKLKRSRFSVSGRVRPVRRRTKSIAILTIGQTRDWLQLPVMAATVVGISRGALEHGFRLMLDEVLDLETPSKALVLRNVDGAVVFVSSAWSAQASSGKALSAIARHLPVIWVMGEALEASGVDHIAPDNSAIGALALEHLKSQGCESVAFLTMNPRWQIMQMRAHAFAVAAHENGIPCHSYVLSTDPREADIFGARCTAAGDLSELVDQLIAARPRPQGLFIGNDATTVQVYPLLHRRGVVPGRDIHVISCDHETIRLSALNPRPASIDVGAEECGWRAVGRLVTRLGKPAERPVRISVAPKLLLPKNGKSSTAFFAEQVAEAV